MKKVFLKIIVITFIFILSVNSFSSNVFAMTSNYASADEEMEYNDDTNSMLSVITDIVLPMIYPLFNGIAKLTQKIMFVFTGEYSFPWADMIIFNRIAILDVNFINPEPGSFFMLRDGTYSTLGETVRNTYFTVLSVSIAFLGIAIAINAIKMLVASLPSDRARYKELISTTLLTIVLIFGMHYVISFTFYINERLVQVASNMSESILNDDTISDAADNLTNAEDSQNEQLVNNFFDECKHTSWWSPITIVKKLVKEGVNKVVEWCKNLGEALKEAWDNFWGNDGDDEITYSDEEKRDNGYYEEVFPSKEDFIGYFNNEDVVGEHGIDIAAYLLKDYIYRDGMLSMVGGNDTNKFANAGIKGWGQSIANTTLWVTGIVDTGLQGLQNLYNSVCYIVNDLPKNYDLSTAASCIKQIEKYTNDENQATDDDIITANHISALYFKAYYRYVYEGDDKEEIEDKTSIIQNMGAYFKRNIYYTDISNGDWSPKTFDAISCILYCVFILQSFMFLFSYIKRFFWVLILSLLGPITVLFDYLKKSY